MKLLVRLLRGKKGSPEFRVADICCDMTGWCSKPRCLMRKLICPNCGSNTWYEGPSGGASTNIQCQGCACWANVIGGEYHEAIRTKEHPWPYLTLGKVGER